MKKILWAFVIATVLVAGCGSDDKQEVEKYIQDAFKIRAETVFKYKDKKALAGYFSPRALEQSREYLNWSPPGGQWDNVKNLKYSIKLRIEDLKVDGKQATATVLETAIISWDYIDPAKVAGTAFVKEDAWTNKKHMLTLSLTPENRWLVDQDIIAK